MEEELSLSIKKRNYEIYEWEQPEELPALRVIYNDAQLKIHQKREIEQLNREIKISKTFYSKKIKESRKSKKSFKKADLKNMSIGRAMSIVHGPERLS